MCSAYVIHVVRTSNSSTFCILQDKLEHIKRVSTYMMIRTCILTPFKYASGSSTHPNCPGENVILDATYAYGPCNVNKSLAQ